MSNQVDQQKSMELQLENYKTDNESLLNENRLLKEKLSKLEEVN